MTRSATVVAALTPTGHMFVGVITVGSLLFVARLVRRHHLRSSYSLLWITVVATMATLAVFPALLDRAASAVGIDYPPAGFLAVAVAFLLVVVVQFSWELSRLNERTRILAEEIALLRASSQDPAGSASADTPPLGA